MIEELNKMNIIFAADVLETLNHEPANEPFLKRDKKLQQGGKIKGYIIGIKISPLYGVQSFS